jgi:hypothetical protein
VNDLIGQVADKWTMLILEVLAEKGELRFTRLSELIEGVSQKMLNADAAPHGARWPIDEDRASFRASKGRIQIDPARLEPWRSFLRRLDLGSEKSRSGREGPR